MTPFAEMLYRSKRTLFLEYNGKKFIDLLTTSQEGVAERYIECTSTGYGFTPFTTRERNVAEMVLIHIPHGYWVEK